ncbi:MAG: hypothetical protein RIR69_85 [Actinomycetota bacterium]|jgi:cytosine/adenosine deaminase-related metal-dependent hydrolase
MPAPSTSPRNFLDILKSVWWKLDAALDADIIYWSAALGAADALLSGTTAIIDHHESPRSIEGSLDQISAACDMIGIRHILCYGVTDRWNDNGELVTVSPATAMTHAAGRGLEENRRYLQSGKPAMVGVHAAFTCGDETLDAACDLAQSFNVGVHIHVAEGHADIDAGERLASRAQSNWLLVHAVHLDRELPGTIIHNPRSNMNNSVGYASPARWSGPVALGTDGIGADMLEEFRLSFARHKEDDLAASADDSWNWLHAGADLVPDVRNDVVTWNYDHVDDPWRVAFTPGIRCTDVSINNSPVVTNGQPLHFDIAEIRAKASEQAIRLFSRLENV